MKILNSTPPPIDNWHTTRWSVLADLEAQEPATWQRSWDELVRAYTPPMERYVRGLLRRLAPGSDAVADTEEVLQGFLAACVEKGWLGRATPEKGRFRAFLQALLKRHVLHFHRHRRAARRHPGPGQSLVPLLDETDEAEAIFEDTEERAGFDAGWAAVLVDRTLRRLEEKHERYGAVVRDLLLTHGEGSPDLAQRLGIRSAQFPVVKHRARDLFARLFAEEFAATVTDPQSYQEEWTSLSAYLP